MSLVDDTLLGQSPGQSLHNTYTNMLDQLKISSVDEKQEQKGPSNKEEQAIENTREPGLSTAKAEVMAVPLVQPQSPSQQLQVENPPQQQAKSPSRTLKLVDKFATFSPSRMKNKSSDRQLIVETAICNRNGNSRKDPQQCDSRAVKSVDTSSKPKKKKRSPINITEGMSRAEIFAANVASAVDAAEAESDEDEEFIYNRDRGHTRTPSLTSLISINQPVQSSNLAYPHMPQENNYGFNANPYQFPASLYAAATRRGPFNTFSHGHRPPFSGAKSAIFFNGNTSGSETEDAPIQAFQKGSSSPSLLSHKPTGVMRASLPDMSQYSKGNPNYGTANYPVNNQLYQHWYEDDDERLPLFAKWRPPYQNQRRPCCTSTTLSLTTLLFLIVAFCYLVFFVSTQPLTDVGIVDVKNVLAANKQLMFDVSVIARNFDIWDVEIVDADIRVFATPLRIGGPGIPARHSSDNNSDDNGDDVESMYTLKNDIKPAKGLRSSIYESSPSSLSLDSGPEYLGRITYFDDPLVFASGFVRTGVVTLAKAQVTLNNPGGRGDKAQDNWSRLLHQGFQLTIRGVLKYSLPFSKDMVARVCYARLVEGSADVETDTEAKNDNYSAPSITNNVLISACGEDWDETEDSSIVVE